MWYASYMITFQNDVRGNELKPGVYVAYNLSGDVARGQLVSAGRGGHGPYKVRLLHKAAGHFPGHISNVRRARAMLVLCKDDA